MFHSELVYILHDLHGKGLKSACHPKRVAFIQHWGAKVSVFSNGAITQQGGRLCEPEDMQHGNITAHTLFPYCIVYFVEKDMQILRVSWGTPEGLPEAVSWKICSSKEAWVHQDHSDLNIPIVSMLRCEMAQLHSYVRSFYLHERLFDIFIFSPSEQVTCKDTPQGLSFY